MAAVSGENSDEPQNPDLEPLITDEDDDDGEEVDDDDDAFEPDEDENGNENDVVFDDEKSLTTEMRDELFYKLLHRLYGKDAAVVVHEIQIHGHSKTKESLIDAQIEALRRAATLPQLLVAAYFALERLKRLEAFDSVLIHLDPGPPEFPNSANVAVCVVETKCPVTGDIGVFADHNKPNSRSFDGSIKIRNVFGHGDIWDGSLVFGWDQMSEASAGVSLPILRRLVSRIPMVARVSLLSQDWQKLSSYNEQSFALSLGPLSLPNHDLECNLSWRSTLGDPSQLSSASFRRQRGQGLNTMMKYTYTIDKRNSLSRPTRGYAFVSTFRSGGLLPDLWNSSFVCQEFDLRCALPLLFCNAALNFGVAAGISFPWNGFLNRPSYLPNCFFLGGNKSPVCTLGGPTSILGFKSRGLRSATEPRSESSEGDFAGGDLAFTSFADLSFDLPLRVLRKAGIYGHTFACAGTLNKLTENEILKTSFHKFRDTFRSSVGLGIIIPTRLFRLEVNYCHILKKQEHDGAKSGLQFCFSSPL